VSKSSTSIAEELEQILQGQYCYFGQDGFASTATPATNAEAQALARQLKMNASPITQRNWQTPPQKQQPQNSSRCNSPDTNEMYSLMASSFGGYGLNNNNTASAITASSTKNGGSA
jgi:hypothetical protein